MTGLMAQDRLALPHAEPPDAIYEIRVGFEVPVLGPFDVKPTYVPARAGGGIEYIFPEGTSPGSVLGPFPILRE